MTSRRRDARLRPQRESERGLLLPERAPSSSGRRLDPDVRTHMEQRLAHDFGAVRIHTDWSAATATDALDVPAFTVGSDVYFAPRCYVPDGVPGARLLAHELTHVRQNERSTAAGGPRPAAVVSRREDASEREAEIAADCGTLAEGKSAVAPASVIGCGAWDWLEETASDAWGGVSDAAGAVGGAVADAGSAVAGVASDAWDTTKGVASGIYSGMKENAGYVRQGEKWLEHGIDWAEGKASAGAHALADQAQGIPVLEQLTGGAAWLADEQSQFTGGVLKGATSLGGGILGMVADPVDTIIGLERMAEHVHLVPGMPNPLQAAHGLYDVLANDADLGTVANRVFNPLESMQDDARFGEQLLGGILRPYEESIREGKGMEAVGRGVFDIGALVLGAGELEGAAAVGETAGALGEAGALAPELAELGELGEAGTLAPELAELGELGESGDLARLGSGVEAGSESAELAQVLEDAGVVEEGASSGALTEPMGEAHNAASYERYKQSLRGEEIADEVAASGKEIRVGSARAATRKGALADLAEGMESGIWNPQTATAVEELGVDQALELAEGEASLSEVGAEVHHPMEVAEAPEFATHPENREILSSGTHRNEVHANEFGRSTEGGALDPGLQDRSPFQPVPDELGTMSPEEVERALEEEAVAQHRDLEGLKDELRDAEGLGSEERAGEQAGDLGEADPEVAPGEPTDYDAELSQTSSVPPEWMGKGAGAGWAEAVATLKRLLKGSGP